ncbi:helix-turn-helix domain-containing protein [Micromonospora sp. HUAS LYJ1]|uniref:helix-turn-helix domain-containing protein n=1 Tax=Micromonospora sp. HUAS LYJ1 TaxID=3061626 RepID=UPI0026715694|nr:helix-turn-helix domain-containing protein [Micromonospora sp. HUAS LYJ1]WKU03741.1 helix-turn-helix domain-containing protein [Micromonospora sp. HUAS LYJ1]
MPRGRPVTQDDYDRVRALHAEGLSRNAIGRQLRRSGKTISEIAVELGLTFDRTQTKVATEARVADAKAKRAALALDLLDDAARLRQQLWEQASYVDHGGKEYFRVDWTLKEPTFADKQRILSSVGIAVDRAVKLDEYDKADASVSGVDAWLAAMTGGGDEDE